MTKTSSGTTPPRTRLDELEPVGRELSPADTDLVAGGTTKPTSKVPLDDDASYVTGVPHSID